MELHSKSEKPRTTLQTVERALSVLEFVAQAHRAPTVKEVATGLDLNLATVYHLYNTLEYRGYLHRDPAGALYIGASAGILHQALVSGPGQGRELHNVIDELSQSVGETAYLTSWADDAVVIQAVVEAPHALRVSGLYVGYRGREIHRASGKAVLAHLDPASQAKVIDRNIAEFGEEVAGKLTASLHNELDEVSRNGFALDNQRYTPGICCVAAPYFSSGGKIAGSVSVSVPAVRFPKRRKPLIEAVIEAARTCSALLGHPYAVSS